jgi:hypothetical protein
VGEAGARRVGVTRNGAGAWCANTRPRGNPLLAQETPVRTMTRSRPPVKPTRRSPRPPGPFGQGIPADPRIVAAVLVRAGLVVAITEAEHPAGAEHRYHVVSYSGGVPVEAAPCDTLGQAEARFRMLARAR